MRTENLDARSNSAFESFPNVGDSTSIRPSATDRGLDSLYVRLQLNMGDHQYIKRSSSHHTLANISVEHHLPYRTLATASPNLHTCTTPDLTSGYSSSAPFSYSLFDSLPTPVSVIGSPSLSDGCSVKMDHSYSNTGTASQQLTPPGASGPSTSEWYQNNHNQSMGQPTQPSSPMPLNPNANILEMHGMRNTLSTPSQAIPVTSDEYHPHWGQYGVSGEEPQDEMSPPLVPSDLFSHIPNVDPSNLMKGYTLPSTNHIALAPAPQVSILGPAPNSGALAPIAPIENYHHPNPFTMTHPPPLFVDVQRSSYKRNPRNANKTRNPPKKRQRGGNRKQSGPSNVGAYEEQAAITQTSPASPRPGADGDTPREVLQFRYDADHPENHDLLDLKMKHLSVKGRGMWDRIVKDWVKTYGTVERAALQMKLQRFVARQAIWPESEDTALKEAIEEYDKRRYKDILIIMKEKGGCRAWDWKMEHIAKRLVELGEEEFDPEMKPKKTRRRRKELQRQRQQPNLWNQPSPPSAYYDQQGLSTATRNELTAEEQERIFSSLFIEEQESQDVDAMDTLEPVPDSRRSSTQRELNQAHSERVAKQACEQLIAQQQQGSASFYQSQYTSQQNNTHTS